MEPRKESGRRFVLLEHTGHPDDPTGRHYDLLLEEPEVCETWRLAAIPVSDGPPVEATRLPPHRLAWLDTEAAEVSGGRGFARRIDAGRYERLPLPPGHPRGQDIVLVRLTGDSVSGVLEINPPGRASLS